MDDLFKARMMDLTPTEFLFYFGDYLTQRFTDPTSRRAAYDRLMKEGAELLVSTDEDRYKIVTLSNVESELTCWLWYGYIPFGGLTILQGDPGIGKGTITMDLAARLSRGRPMPNSELETEPADTILLTIAEDDLRATIKPRLEAADADCSRIHAFESLLELPGDIMRIEQAIRDYKAKLVIVDPLNAYLSAQVDSHKDQAIRGALSPLKILAEQTGAAIVMVHHMNKAPGASAMYRGGGSIGITGAARCVLLVEKHPLEAELRVLARVKGNLSAAPPSLAYQLESASGMHVARLEWEGVVELTADELLNPPKDEQKADVKAQEAIEFYRRELGDGQQRASKEIDELLKAEGIAYRTAERARKSLGVKSTKEGFGKDSGWYVYLPNSANSDNDVADYKTMADFDKVGGVHDDVGGLHNGNPSKDRQIFKDRQELTKTVTVLEAGDAMADFDGVNDEEDGEVRL